MRNVVTLHVFSGKKPKKFNVFNKISNVIDLN